MGEGMNYRPLTVPVLATLAYEPKVSHGFGLDMLHNQRIQAARDATACTCLHGSISHAYDRLEAGTTWPDGSRLGRGECGFCDCQTFTDRSDR